MAIRIESRAKTTDTASETAKPASSFVETGPKDELAAKDVYQPLKGLGREPVEELEDATNRNSPITGGAINRLNDARLAAQPNNIWNALVCGEPPPRVEPNRRRARRMDFASMWQRQADCSAEDIAQLITVEDGRLTLDQDELDKRMDMILGPAKDLISEDQRANIAGAIAMAMGASPTTASAVVGGVESLLDESNYEDAKSFTELLAQITGDEDLASILDLSSEFGLLESMVQRAIDLGIPQAIDHILDEFDSDEERRRALLNSLRIAAIQSDFTTINKILDSHGTDAALSRVPNLITLILQHYDWGLGVSREDYPAKRDELINLLNRIDSNWHKTERNGQEIDDLTPFAKASDKARTLLKMSPEHFVDALIAPEYPSIDIQWAARKYHPLVVFAAA